MRHFTYRNLNELRQGADETGARHVVFEDNSARVTETLGRPVMVRDFRVGNAMAIHPMEGCDSTLDGRPDELTWRRYERFARGGAKLIWFEATAVREDGRANSRQLWITRANMNDYSALRLMMERVHREQWGTSDDLFIPVQLTHSGRYSVPQKTLAYHNPYIDQKSGTPADYPCITDDELERLEDDYVAAARLAIDAGFRAIDIKVTHGYLLSELMGARTREGRYGGPVENRTRFVRNVLGKMRAALGSEVIYCVRLGCFDSVPFFRDPATGLGVACQYETPYPYGFGVDPNSPLEEDLTDVIETIRRLRDAGVSLVNVSLGCPYYNPHVGRPFEKPDDGNYEQPEHPLVGVDRHFRIAGRLQREFPDLPMVGTGYSWLQKYAINAGAKNVADGNIRFLGIGRGALAYPDFAAATLDRGELDEMRVCKTLTFCTYLMRQKNHPLGQFPTGCPPFDKEGYGEIMKEARLAQRAQK
ncbi:MAG: NADH:flavin oxidoreductase [Bryobacteraceae bacterium]